MRLNRERGKATRSIRHFRPAEPGPNGRKTPSKALFVVVTTPPEWLLTTPCSPVNITLQILRAHGTTKGGRVLQPTARLLHRHHLNPFVELRIWTNSVAYLPNLGREEEGVIAEPLRGKAYGCRPPAKLAQDAPPMR
jgi:hypothetical protein